MSDRTDTDATYAIGPGTVVHAQRLTWRDLGTVQAHYEQLENLREQKHQLQREGIKLKAYGAKSARHLAAFDVPITPEIYSHVLRSVDQAIEDTEQALRTLGFDPSKGPNAQDWSGVSTS